MCVRACGAGVCVRVVRRRLAAQVRAEMRALFDELLVALVTYFDTVRTSLVEHCFVGETGGNDDKREPSWT